MKIIFSSPDPFAVAGLRNALESAGVACFMRNEVSAGLAPEVPMTESTPELWIQDDEKLPQAQQIKRDWQNPAKVVGSAWTCRVCGEKLEPQFTTCWKCGFARE